LHVLNPSKNAVRHHVKTQQNVPTNQPKTNNHKTQSIKNDYVKKKPNKHKTLYVLNPSKNAVSTLLNPTKCCTTTQLDPPKCFINTKSNISKFRNPNSCVTKNREQLPTHKLKISSYRCIARRLPARYTVPWSLDTCRPLPPSLQFNTQNNRLACRHLATAPCHQLLPMWSPNLPSSYESSTGSLTHENLHKLNYKNIHDLACRFSRALYYKYKVIKTICHRIYQFALGSGDEVGIICPQFK
jgi:hypothetical protein